MEENLMKPLNQFSKMEVVLYILVKFTKVLTPLFMIVLIIKNVTTVL